MKVKILLFMMFMLLHSVMAMAQLTAIGSAFNAPTGIAFDRVGAMYVTNWSGNSIAKISAKGERTVFYDGIPSPAGIAIDADNNVYVSSYSDNFILKINQEGKVQKIFDGYHTPAGLAFSLSGQLLVANRSTGEIVALDLASGATQRLASNLSLPVGVVQLADGRLVVPQYSGRLTLIQNDGQTKEIGDAFNRPGVGIINYAPNLIAVIDNGADCLRQVDMTTGEVKTLASALRGAVALSWYQNAFYIGTWGDGTVYRLTLNNEK